MLIQWDLMGYITNNMGGVTYFMGIWLGISPQFEFKQSTFGSTSSHFMGISWTNIGNKICYLRVRLFQRGVDQRYTLQTAIAPYARGSWKKHIVQSSSGNMPMYFWLSMIIVIICNYTIHTVGIYVYIYTHKIHAYKHT